MARVPAWIAWLGLLLILGCAESPPEPVMQPLSEPVAIGSQFDAAMAGMIRGKVVWSGTIPAVDPYEVRSWTMDPQHAQPRALRANPHAPLVHSETRGVVGAVVFLKAVDPKGSRPWHHGPVVVEHRERLLEVVQGGKRARVGFVRQGEAITMVSREKEFNALHASGAAFFTLTFPEPDQPLMRPLRDKGLIALGSNAGWYWMQAHLFVADHPYYTLTDSQGHFELAQVPAGRYELVCWMPNWHGARQDRDPESGLVTRIAFHAPMEQQREVVVPAGGVAMADFTVQAEQFKR
jgi:hypothetical protein